MTKRTFYKTPQKYKFLELPGGKRRVNLGGWRAVKKCVLFFTAVCVAPVALVLLVTIDRVMSPVNHILSKPLQPPPKAVILAHEPVLSHNLTLVAKRLQERKKFLKEACHELGLDKPGNDSLHRPDPWEFLVDYRHRLVWCNVFKAGSTSWMYNFNILAGYNAKFLAKTKTVPMTLARYRYPRPTLEELKLAFKNSVSFLITRHPFERLLSAYRDKLRYALPHTQYSKLGREIVQKYRKHKLGQKKITTTYPTFPEFVTYLLHLVHKGEKLDMHWTPITEFCTPCMFDFDIIAHTETLQDDQVYIIKKAQLEHLIQPQWKNVGKAGKGSTLNHISKYYSELTKSQILELFDVYKYDFQIFNYSIQGYIEIAKDDNDNNNNNNDIYNNNHRKNAIDIKIKRIIN